MLNRLATNEGSIHVLEDLAEIDFVTVDPTNDTLLITQTDRLIRLSGASLTTTTPEPSYLWLLIGGIAALAVFRWRRAVRQS
jgi:hypothetical protein